MRATTVALLSVTSRPLSGFFLAAALFSTACSTSGLSPYSEDEGQDTAASVDDTGTGEEPGTDDDSGSGGSTDTQEASACPTGEVEDCNGDCLPEAWLGDGLCQSRFDCAATGYDDGDCAQEPDTGTGGSGGTNPGCPSGQVEDCSGTCAPRNAIGDGTCDARFDCSVHGYDDGDCADTGTGTGSGTGGCAADEISDCSGGCLYADWLGDTICDPEFDCAALDNDDGDCTTSGGGGQTCPSGYVLGCDGVTCVQAAWVGDYYCDGALDCAATGYDDGDCVSCYPDQVIDCFGGCTGAEKWNNDACDASLDCAMWDYDYDDCEAACPAGEILGCDGVTCVPASWEGDYYCDAELDCAATGYDDGDCWICYPGEITNCDGGCTDPLWLGDDMCDYELDCYMWDYDDGDCW